MRIKRSKFVEIIVNNVAEGNYPGYKKSFNGQFIYNIKKGNQVMYKNDPDASGVTVIYQNFDPSQSHEYFENIEDAIELVSELEAQSFEMAEYHEKLGNYIRTHKLY